MILSFFLLSGPSAMNDFFISDLFDIKQGKQLIDRAGETNSNTLDRDDVQGQKISILTTNAVNFDTKSIDPNCLLNFNLSRPIDSNSFLSSNSYIVNRVGRNKTMSLLDVEDFDFDKNKTIAGNDYIYLQPRKIVLNNLPFFHALLDIALKELIDEKILNLTSKVQYITVKEIANKKISVPSLEFNEINKRFMEVYEPYKKLLKKFNISKKKLSDFKNDVLKKK